MNTNHVQLISSQRGVHNLSMNVNTSCLTKIITVMCEDVNTSRIDILNMITSHPQLINALSTEVLSGFDMRELSCLLQIKNLRYKYIETIDRVIISNLRPTELSMSVLSTYDSMFPSSLVSRIVLHLLAFLVEHDSIERIKELSDHGYLKLNRHTFTILSNRKKPGKIDDYMTGLLCGTVSPIRSPVRSPIRSPIRSRSVSPIRSPIRSRSVSPVRSPVRSRSVLPIRSRSVLPIRSNNTTDIVAHNQIRKRVGKVAKNPIVRDQQKAKKVKKTTQRRQIPKEDIEAIKAYLAEIIDTKSMSKLELLRSFALRYSIHLILCYRHRGNISWSTYVLNTNNIRKLADIGSSEKRILYTGSDDVNVNLDLLVEWTVCVK